MAAKAICDVCSIETLIETIPLGLALMPKTWFVSVTDNEGELKAVDVCGVECAQAYDKSHGRNQTLLAEETASGDIANRTIEHKADN